MVVGVYVFETRGGAVLAQVEPAEVTWSLAGNDADEVTLKVDLNDATEGARDWRSLASPWNHSVAVDLGGRYVGGPIMPSSLDDSAGTLTVTARGIRAALARRTVMPALALTQPLVVNGKPNAALDSYWRDWEYGTIGKFIVQQALSWPGWSEVPMSYPASRPSNKFRGYSAVNLTRVDDALEDLTNLVGGPDIRFVLERLGPDQFGFRYVAGTEAEPRVRGGAELAWEAGQASGLTIQTNPSRMASVAWAVAGATSDVVLGDMLYDPTLVAAGGLLLEAESEVPSSEDDPTKLRAYNAETLRTSLKPWEFWTMSVPADVSPLPSEYSPGDVADVIVTKDAPVSGGYVPPGAYRRRIAAMSGGSGSDAVQITFGEAYDG